MKYNDTSNREKANNFFWHLRFNHIFFFARNNFFFKWAVFSSKSIFLRKVLACEMVQGESSPCSGTLEGYMWWQRKTTDSAKIYVEKENNYRATDTNAIRNPKEVIAKKRKYGDTVNFCLMSTFLFWIQLLKNNFKIKLSCLWVSCLKGGSGFNLIFVTFA